LLPRPTRNCPDHTGRSFDRTLRCRQQHRRALLHTQRRYDRRDERYRLFAAGWHKGYAALKTNGCGKRFMTEDDFRRLALSFPETIESANMGHPGFRVRGKIFATLLPDKDTGMAKLNPEQQEW